MIQLEAIRPLRYRTVRKVGEVFSVSNEAWANFYESRGLARRFVPPKAKADPKPKAEKPKKIETDRAPDTQQAAVNENETLTG